MTLLGPCGAKADGNTGSTGAGRGAVETRQCSPRLGPQYDSSVDVKATEYYSICDNAQSLPPLPESLFCSHSRYTIAPRARADGGQEVLPLM
jgi:hypothetical protein